MGAAAPGALGQEPTTSVARGNLTPSQWRTKKQAERRRVWNSFHRPAADSSLSSQVLVADVRASVGKGRSGLASLPSSRVCLSPIMVLEALRSVSSVIPQASIPPAAAAVVQALASLPIAAPVIPDLGVGVAGRGSTASRFNPLGSTLRCSLLGRATFGLAHASDGGSGHAPRPCW